MRQSKVASLGTRTPSQVPFGALGYIDEAGKPHVIPICYVYDRGSLYSSIDEKPKRRNPTHLRRVLNIIENPNVALVVDQYGEDWSRLKYVTLRGFAEILSTGAEYERAIRLLREKYAQYRRMRLESRPIIKIRLISVFAWRPLGGGHPKSQVPSEPI